MAAVSTPTPELPFSRAEYAHIYEPAEDTFLLLDALDADAALLRDGSRRLCVEIGSGSGCVSAFAAAVVGKNDCAHLCTDINPHAASATARTGSANSVALSPILSPLLSSLSSRSRAAGGLIDILLFNPPYVPTTAEEEAAAQAAGGIAGAWAGGATGTNLVEALLEDGLETILAPGGLFYLLALRANDPPALVAKMQAKGLLAEIAMQRRAGGEHLFVIRAQRPR
ncbi:putative methylase [Tilletiopsis washingtonensis]|uniref:Putative methylase n=1 Tax=Tilletiopsis washingtonensis TaxID=58919 RepID=A0A316Z7A0_9BASI|nr:putative methylase [Tilletiopsis washingtonensis]PWN96848.1 putative methylase [Tilletiopsis washingtonensis]